MKKPVAGECLKRLPRGFTLVELLVVIAIITILGGLVLGALSSAQRRAKISKTEVVLKQIASAMDRYEMDYGDYPPSDGDDGIKGAQSLWRCLNAEGIKNGPYLKLTEVPTVDTTGNSDLVVADAWNRPIYYIHHHDYHNKPPNKLEYRLMSAGPDGFLQGGTPESDDVVNWDKNKPEQN